MTHKFKKGYWANAFYQVKLIFLRPSEFRENLPPEYTRLDFVTHLLYLQPVTILILLFVMASFLGLIRILEFSGSILPLLENPFPWSEIVFGIAGTVVWGIILGIALGCIFERTFKIIFGSVLGIVFEITLGSAYGIAVGVSQGVVEGIAFGVAIGIAVGIAYGVAGGIAEDITEGIVVGITFGIAYGIEGGLAEGITVGVAGGLTYIISVSRIWYLPYHLLQYLITLLVPDRVIPIYQSSPLHFDELIGFPLPFLSSILIRIIDQDRELGLKNIEFLTAKRPAQEKAAQKALAYANSK